MKYYFENEKELLIFLKEQGETSLFAEICALIGIDKNKKIVYEKMQNRSKNPDQYFLIDPYDFLSFIKENEILAAFHSHLVGDEKPSSFDEKSSENCCFSFIIYSINTEKFFIYEPKYKKYDVNTIQRLKELI
jgi:proteasome lid subunit RPN8/RPN11